MHKSKLTKLLCLVLSLMMILCAAPITVFAADESVTYIERSWDAAGKKVVEETKTASATAITGSETTLNGGWYVVKGSVLADNRITVNGDNDNPTCIILADGCMLKASSGITVNSDKALVIYGQTGETGLLEAIAGIYNAAIGGPKSAAGGTVIVNGGTVTAIGGEYGAGIGGGRDGNGGKVTINGGTVNATGGDYGAGIGSGYGTFVRGGGTVIVNGGTITAKGGRLSAGIGGGNQYNENDWN